MIFRVFIIPLMLLYWAPTEKELTNRFVAVLVFLGVVFILLVLTLCLLQKKRIRKIPALILAAALIFEASGAIPYLQGEIQIPLEYVGSVDSACTLDPAKWYTDYSVCSPEPVNKKRLEYALQCDLEGLDLSDSRYTYLFVVNYKDVELYYSKWTETTGYSGNPDFDQVVFIGRLAVAGKATNNTIYIFRFPRQPIVPYDAQWL